MINSINKSKQIKEKRNNKKNDDYHQLNKNKIKKKINNNPEKKITTTIHENIQIPDYLIVNQLKEGRIKNYSYFSKEGENLEGSIKINQDFHLILPNINNNKDFNIFCLMDGHGPTGHFISSFISKYLSNFFKNNEAFNIKNLSEINYLLHENDFSLMKKAIKKAEKELFKNTKIDSYFSGTTCIILIQLGDRIICSNIGDSKAIMIKSYERIIKLSLEHKPFIYEESLRIKANGGEICQMEEYGNKIGPFRIWKKGEKYPGIDISRSIGDSIATKLGVISKPDFIEKSFDKETKFIVIMSKGVYEYLSDKEIMDIVMPFYLKNDPKGASQALCNIARILWKKNDFIVDDTTAIVIFF